jgi:ribonucleoside-diphosphate reductase alpha chain
MAQSVMDYIFRRLALDYLPYEKREELGIFTAAERAATVAATSYGAPAAPVADEDDDVEVELESMRESVPVEVRSSMELVEAMQGASADAPLCMSCGVKMKRAGSCYVCESCGSTSGCS